MFRRALINVLFAGSLVVCGCTTSLSPEEAAIAGKWLCDTKNGALWEYSFRRNRKVSVQNVAERADGSYSKLVRSGTWRVADGFVVYSLSAVPRLELPETTDRVPLAEFQDTNRWERR